MIGFFRRTKIEVWEMDILKNVLMQLPIEYIHLKNQVDKGLFKGVLIGISDIPGYVGFSFNPKVYNEFYSKDGRNYKLTNIKVIDSISGQYVGYSIYVSFGLINGYSIDSIQKYKVDTSKVDVSNFQRVYLDEGIHSNLSAFLNQGEIALINLSEVDAIFIEGREYYRIKELEDGDFLGVDINRNVYKITHNPPEVNLLPDKIEDILSRKDNKP